MFRLLILKIMVRSKKNFQAFGEVHLTWKWRRDEENKLASLCTFFFSLLNFVVGASEMFEIFVRNSQTVVLSISDEKYKSLILTVLMWYTLLLSLRKWIWKLRTRNHQPIGLLHGGVERIRERQFWIVFSFSTHGYLFYMLPPREVWVLFLVLASSMMDFFQFYNFFPIL